MILILIAIIAAVVLTGILFRASDMYGDLKGIIIGLIAVTLGFATSITVITYCYVTWSWIASEHKTKIINREYGTNYTQEEVFYAGSVINTIRELDRKRIEVNGNLMTQGKK